MMLIYYVLGLAVLFTVIVCIDALIKARSTPDYAAIKDEWRDTAKCRQTALEQYIQAARERERCLEG